MSSAKREVVGEYVVNAAGASPASVIELAEQLWRDARKPGTAAYKLAQEHENLKSLPEGDLSTVLVVEESGAPITSTSLLVDGISAGAAAAVVGYDFWRYIVVPRVRRKWGDLALAKKDREDRDAKKKVKKAEKAKQADSAKLAKKAKKSEKKADGTKAKDKISKKATKAKKAKQQDDGAASFTVKAPKDVAPARAVEVASVSTQADTSKPRVVGRKAAAKTGRKSEAPEPDQTPASGAKITSARNAAGAKTASATKLPKGSAKKAGDSGKSSDR